MRRAIRTARNIVGLVLVAEVGLSLFVGMALMLYLGIGLLIGVVPPEVATRPTNVRESAIFVGLLAQFAGLFVLLLILSLLDERDLIDDIREGLR